MGFRGDPCAAAAMVSQRRLSNAEGLALQTLRSPEVELGARKLHPRDLRKPGIPNPQKDGSRQQGATCRVQAGHEELAGAAPDAAVPAAVRRVRRPAGAAVRPAHELVLLLLCMPARTRRLYHSWLCGTGTRDLTHTVGEAQVLQMLQIFLRAASCLYVDLMPSWPVHRCLISFLPK